MLSSKRRNDAPRVSPRAPVPMKICHIITRLILGGAQENTLLTCEGLHQKGHDVTLITGPAIGPEGELLTRAKAGGYRVILLDSLRREISWKHDRRARRELRELLCQLEPDVVHTHSSKAGILGRGVADELRRTGTLPAMKIIHTIHGLAYHRYNRWWKNRLYIALEKRAARQSDAILSVADAMTAQAVLAGVGQVRQYATVRSGMETEPFVHPTPAIALEARQFRDSLKLPPEAVLVTQVSRLAELKGHDDLLQAAARLSNRTAEGKSPVIFCFVGDGHFRERIEKKIARTDHAHLFRLTGLLPPAQIPAVMHATDILAHCSYREGLARTLPQAMLAGKPVISWDVDGAREVVSQETGILLRPRDIPGLTAAIEVLADHPALRETLGLAGQSRCEKEFDHTYMVEQIEQAYLRSMR